MLNYVWLAFLVVAVLVGGFTGKLPDLTSGAFEGAEKAVMKVILPLLGIWAIWLGMMRLAERAGLVQALAWALRPLMRRLFPDVPRDHPAVGAMVMNMAANMLGLGNAATPLGLRAMRLLESLNPSPGVATNAMCTFLALNTASIQILPLTAIGILVTAGAKSATSIVITAFLATLCAASAGVLAAKFLEKLPRFRVKAPSIPANPANPAAPEPGVPADARESIELETIALPPLTKKGRIGIALYLAAFAAMFLLLLFPTYFSGLLGQFHAGWSAPSAPPDFEGKSVGIRSLMAISLLAIPFLLSFLPLYAALRGVAVYEQFVEGAKEAWGTAQRTIPYLVAMLVAIGMLQKAGVIDLLTHWISPLLGAVGFPADLLPMVLMRPLSGSATNGLFVELVQRLHDPDGFVSRLAGTIYGSTETTFYVLTVYFGSVSIRQTRHAVITGLTADTVAVIASVFFCRLLFR
jgi:spore maturation protein SpmA